MVQCARKRRLLIIIYVLCDIKPLLSPRSVYISIMIIDLNISLILDFPGELLQSSEKPFINCLAELSKIIRNRDIIDKLSELLFQSVYDRDRKECRYFSVLDRLATSVSRYSAKASLFDLKRGSLSGTEKPISLGSDVVEALDVIERCLDIDELLALEVLKTIALNALSRCFKST